MHKHSVNIILEIYKARDDIYAAVIAKNIGAVWTYTVGLIQKLIAAGLVNFEKVGVYKRLVLTQKGIEVAEKLDKIMSTLKS